MSRQILQSHFDNSFEADVNSSSALDVIEVKDLYKHYDELVAIKGINFSVRKGEIFGLIGPDGAGKTSTFHILGGIMEASAGKVTVLGKPPRQVRLSIGYLTQKFSLYSDLTIEENLRYSAGVRQVSSHVYIQLRNKYLQLVNLQEFSDRLAGQLSGGMKQKLALCCALISQPEILLLDEPTTGVDPISRRDFWDILVGIAHAGMTIVVATPYLDEAERCHRIAFIHKGKIEQIGILSELRDSLALKRLEVRTPELESVEKILIAHCHKKFLVDVQTFGDHLDVLVKNSHHGKTEIENLCELNKVKLNSIQVVEPTLENVFITRLQQLENPPPFKPFPHDQVNHFRENSDLAIEVNSLGKVFGNFKAVKEINLEVRYGEIYGLLGANGAGKTTTIKMLCGLIEPTTGQLSLAGTQVNSRSSQLRQKIGYMSQKFTLYDDLTILENLEFYCGVYGVSRRSRRRKIEWVLETCGLQGKEKMLTSNLPGGWKQRVAFGASVMHEPSILFLDEPTSGVDPLARRQFWKLINQFARSGTSILVTTHYLEEAEQCNRIGFMVGGEIVAQGSPSELKATQPGELIELSTNNIQQTYDLLKKELEPWRVSFFGDRIHVILINPDLEISQIETILKVANIQVFLIRPIPFSLEDVFINIVELHSKRD